MNYAIKDKNSNRCIAIIDSTLLKWFKENLPIFDIVEIDNIGISTLSISEGSINTFSIFPKGKHFSKDALHMINSFPKELSLEEAYKKIN